MSTAIEKVLMKMGRADSPFFWCSLSFSPCGRFLASSSNTETVHVFRLDGGEATVSGGATGAGIKHAEIG